MNKYRYVKAPPGYTLKKKKSPKSMIKRFIFLIMIIFGVSSITSVLYPIISYQLIYAPSFKKTKLLSPLSQTSDNTSGNLTPEIINTALDYTDSSNWFVGKSDSPNYAKSRISIYKLSIPQLNIKDAIVRSDTTNLKQSLVHYQGTPLPGQLGTPVIFGHSVLPQYFDPENYISIFSTLHTLKIGDEIFIEHDGIKYRYVIQSMYEVAPTDLSPLSQNYQSRNLRVITCTPPGTYLRRLVIEASLI